MGPDRGVYRTGGDEFAVLVDDQRAWGALELTQRLQGDLAEIVRPIGVSISAGIADADSSGSVTDLLHEADLALLAAKRSQQGVVIYTPELDNERAGVRVVHTGTLANALALAVDAKDPYTRSHCQTVSQLCALVAAEIGLSPERIARMRLGGLLHDVGKIGIPDAILNKPARLTEAEHLQMQRHATLGSEIVAAADLLEESRWVRHHHERYDGNGYPDQARGRGHPARVADHPRLRLVRGDDVEPPLPQGARTRLRHRGAPSQRRHPVRPSHRRWRSAEPSPRA